MSDKIAPAAQAATQKKRKQTATPRRLRMMLALDDFEVKAKNILPRQIYGYYSGAAETNQSRDENRAIFRQYSFEPRVLSDVSRRKTTASLLGTQHAYPFGIAPMGLSALATFDGDAVLARAAAAENIPMVMSATSLTPLERMASQEGGKWFQLYLPGDNGRIEKMLDRVEAAGFENIVLTVDVNVPANRENNVRTGFSSPLKPSLRLFYDGMIHPKWSICTFMRTMLRGMPHFENMDHFRGPAIISRNFERDIGPRDQLDWSHVELIRKRWKGKFVVKGILTAVDALRAKAHGVDAVWISNHGGRQLDGAASPMAVLPAIRRAVGNYPLLIDSGIRRGSDILKALALGADFAFIGRPFLYAAAVGGETAVRHAIKLLGEEVNRDLALLGLNAVGELTPDFVRDNRLPVTV